MLGEILSRPRPTTAQALEALYLRVLARRPNAQGGQQICGRYLEIGRQPRARRFEDILWSLINSTEFISRR